MLENILHKLHAQSYHRTNDYTVIRLLTIQWDRHFTLAVIYIFQELQYKLLVQHVTLSDILGLVELKVGNLVFNIFTIFIMLIIHVQTL